MTFIHLFPFILCFKGENMGVRSRKMYAPRVNDFLRTKKVWEGVWEEDRPKGRTDMKI